MTPVLHEVLSCDGLITGTPVYFGAETGLCRNFIERLFFPLLRYDATHSSLAPKAIPLLFVYTMNVTEELMHKIQYPEHLGIVQKFAGRILRSPSTDVLYVCDTFQFDDYSRYDAPLFDAAAKQKVRDTKFQEDCRKAFIAGSKLVKP
jgi:multimeric flavodoxin WrbA